MYLPLLINPFPATECVLLILVSSWGQVLAKPTHSFWETCYLWKACTVGFQSGLDAMSCSHMEEFACKSNDVPRATKGLKHEQFSVLRILFEINFFRMGLWVLHIWDQITQNTMWQIGHHEPSPSESEISCMTLQAMTASQFQQCIQN